MNLHCKFLQKLKKGASKTQQLLRLCTHLAANKESGTVQGKGVRPTQYVLYPLKELLPLENSFHKQQLLPKDEMNQQVLLLPYREELSLPRAWKRTTSILKKANTK